MFKELFTEGGGGPRGNFNISEPSNTDAYAKAMDNYQTKTMKALKDIARKFGSRAKPRAYDSRSGAVGDTYELILFESKSGKNRVSLRLYPNYGSVWTLTLELGVRSSGSFQSSISARLAGGSISDIDPKSIQDALIKIASHKDFEDKSEDYMDYEKDEIEYLSDLFGNL